MLNELSISTPTMPLRVRGVGMMSTSEFIQIQTDLGLTIRATAKLLRVTEATIYGWRAGKSIVGPVGLAMRMLKSHPEELQFWKDTQKVIK